MLRASKVAVIAAIAGSRGSALGTLAGWIEQFSTTNFKSWATLESSPSLYVKM